MDTFVNIIKGWHYDLEQIKESDYPVDYYKNNNSGFFYVRR